jgi:hypothetical protein
LLELQLMDWDALPPAMTEIAVEHLGAETVARLDRFFQRLGAAAADDRPLSEVCTEEQLRALWQATEHEHAA